MNRDICAAIDGRRVVKFYYNGGNRVVEPHCYGIHKDTDNAVLCGFQTGGYSDSGNLPGWRLYIVHQIQNLVVTEDMFSGPRPQYNPTDSRMSQIFCNL